MQSTETVEMADGILTMTREGRKLVKVSYETKLAAQYREMEAYAIEREVELKRCQECGTWLESNGSGYWVDLSNRFLCHKSPTSMHRIAR